MPTKITRHAHSPANADKFHISREYIQTIFSKSYIEALHAANAIHVSCRVYNLENLAKNPSNTSLIRLLHHHSISCSHQEYILLARTIGSVYAYGTVLVELYGNDLCQFAGQGFPVYKCRESRPLTFKVKRLAVFVAIL